MSPGRSRGRRRRADVLRVADVLRAACAQLGLRDVEVEPVRTIGAGLNRRALAAFVRSPSTGWERGLCALLPRRDGSAPDVERERRVLAFLAARELPFRVPRVAVVVEHGGERILVREFLDGIPADRFDLPAPWDLVADVAAAIHRIPTDELGWLPGHATCRAHAEHAIAELAAVADDAAEVRDALAWMRAHLPPDEPSRLLQGDLLGQNLLVWPTLAPGIADWEYAMRGDPAYDLAIVTRGARRPFGSGGGLRNLLAAYAERSGTDLAVERVQLHELGLCVGFHRAKLARGAGSAEIQASLQRIASVLRRLRR